MPPEPVAAIVIEPAPLVIDTPEPAVSVVRTKPTPVLPMSIWPFVGAEVRPVPPFATGNVPVTPVDRGSPVRFVAVPEDGVPKAPPFTTKAPEEPVFTPSAVTTPVPVVIVLGATPAPPPIIRAFADKAEELASVPDAE